MSAAYVQKKRPGNLIAKTTYQRRLAEVLEAKVPGHPELRHAILRYRVDHTDPEIKGKV